MTDYMQKDVLLQKIQDSYTAFSTLIATLDRDQLTTPGVNGKWSIKDNIAHLSAWQKRTVDILQTLRDNTIYVNPTPDMSDDDINEQFYQANRARTLEDVQSELSTVNQQVIASVQELTEAQINNPLPRNEKHAIWEKILGDTTEHFEEHTQIIQSWLAKQP
jgi:hypothetical protein